MFLIDAALIDLEILLHLPLSQEPYTDRFILIVLFVGIADFQVLFAMALQVLTEQLYLIVYSLQ